jgi:hypothetical protein
MNFRGKFSIILLDRLYRLSFIIESSIIDIIIPISIHEEKLGHSFMDTVLHIDLLLSSGPKE